MNTQKRKLTLAKETLRDLAVQNAAALKGGKDGKTGGKRCYPNTEVCGSLDTSCCNDTWSDGCFPW
jgi:hypothetical protein